MKQIRVKNLKWLTNLIEPHKPILIIGHKGTGKTKLAAELARRLNMEVKVNKLTPNLDEAINIDKSMIHNESNIYINSCLVELLSGHFEQEDITQDKDYSIEELSNMLTNLFSKVNVIYTIADKKFILSNLLSYKHEQTERIFTNFENKINGYTLIFYGMIAKQFKGSILNYNNIYAKHKIK